MKRLRINMKKTNKKVATDLEIVKLARKMEYHRREMVKLEKQIEKSGHPNVEQMIESLHANDLPPLAWATHAIHSHLCNPDAWDYGPSETPAEAARELGIWHKVAKKAVLS